MPRPAAIHRAPALLQLPADSGLLLLALLAASVDNGSAGEQPSAPDIGRALRTLWMPAWLQ